MLKPAEQRIKQYRDVIPAKFDATNGFVTSLPALSPPPGSTPDPVTVTAAWVPAQNKAVLNWTASANPNLASYSVRACTGTSYKAANETVIADVAKTVLTFATTDPLPVPGAQAVYRVYVVLTTGNEHGSNSAAVTRA